MTGPETPGFDDPGFDDLERFDGARRLGGLSLQQLLLRYVALGGSGDVFELEAFLQGLAPLEPFQRDVLAHALNERLQEVFDAARVPYLDAGLRSHQRSRQRSQQPSEDILRALDEVLDDGDGNGNDDERSPSSQESEADSEAE